MPFPGSSDLSTAGHGVPGPQCLIRHLLASIVVLCIPTGFGESDRHRDTWPARIWDRADAMVERAREIVDGREATSLQRVADSRIDSMPLVVSSSADVRAVARDPENRRELQ